jgi:hypothetical protein
MSNIVDTGKTGVINTDAIEWVQEQTNLLLSKFDTGDWGDKHLNDHNDRLQKLSLENSPDFTFQPSTSSSSKNHKGIATNCFNIYQHDIMIWYITLGQPGGGVSRFPSSKNSII